MGAWIENPSVMLRHGQKDAVEENEHQHQYDEKQARGEPPKDEPEATRDTEIGEDE
jgi:hypothetical protein